MRRSASATKASRCALSRTTLPSWFDLAWARSTSSSSRSRRRCAVRRGRRRRACGRSSAISCRSWRCGRTKRSRGPRASRNASRCDWRRLGPSYRPSRGSWPASYARDDAAATLSWPDLLRRRGAPPREAEHLARRAGNVWLQISALVWMLAIEPQASTARRLHQLLDITAWRQPVLAPPEVAADAALAMTVTGERGRSILELALTAGRPAATTEVVMRHLDDPNVTSAARTAAVDVLGLVGTMQARDILARLAKRNDDVG